MSRTMRGIGIVACAVCTVAAFVSVARADGAIRHARSVASAADDGSDRRIGEEIRALRREIADLDRLHRLLDAEEPCVVDVSGEARAMADRALRESVSVSRISVDSSNRLLTASGVGSAASVREWIRRIDDLAAGGCAVATRFELTAIGKSAVAVELVVTFPGDGASPPANVPRSHLQASMDSWPVATASQFAEAFARRTAPEVDSVATESPLALEDTMPLGARSRYHLRPSGITFLGTIGYSDGTVSPAMERFAVRIEPEAVVAVLGVGETAYGWSVIDADTTALVLERKGVTYEMDR